MAVVLSADSTHITVGTPFGLYPSLHCTVAVWLRATGPEGTIAPLEIGFSGQPAAGREAKWRQKRNRNGGKTNIRKFKEM